MLDGNNCLLFVAEGPHNILSSILALPLAYFLGLVKMMTYLPQYHTDQIMFSRPSSLFPFLRYLPYKVVKIKMWIVRAL